MAQRRTLFLVECRTLMDGIQTNIADLNHNNNLYYYKSWQDLPDLQAWHK